MIPFKKNSYAYMVAYSSEIEPFTCEGVIQEVDEDKDIITILTSSRVLLTFKLSTRYCKHGKIHYFLKESRNDYFCLNKNLGKRTKIENMLGMLNKDELNNIMHYIENCIIERYGENKECQK